MSLKKLWVYFKVISSNGEQKPPRINGFLWPGSTFFESEKAERDFFFFWMRKKEENSPKFNWNLSGLVFLIKSAPEARNHFKNPKKVKWRFQFEFNTMSHFEVKAQGNYGLESVFGGLIWNMLWVINLFRWMVFKLNSWH